MLELILSIAVGYFLGPLVILLFGILLIVFPAGLVLKALFSDFLSDKWQRYKQKRRLKKLLKERLSYLP